MRDISSGERERTSERERWEREGGERPLERRTFIAARQLARLQG